MTFGQELDARLRYMFLIPSSRQENHRYLRILDVCNVANRREADGTHGLQPHRMRQFKPSTEPSPDCLAFFAV